MRDTFFLCSAYGVEARGTETLVPWRERHRRTRAVNDAEKAFVLLGTEEKIVAKKAGSKVTILLIRPCWIYAV